MSIDHKRFDVFVSCKGGSSIETHAYPLVSALKGAQLDTFYYNDYKRPGREIEVKIRTALKNSSSAIILFSRNYADSYWCLEELRLILKRDKGSVFPLAIIYCEGVSYRDLLSKVNSNYYEALKRHKKASPVKKTKWKEALKDAGCREGYAAPLDKQERDMLFKVIAECIKKEISKVPQQPERTSKSIGPSGVPDPPDFITGLDDSINNLKGMLLSDPDDPVVPYSANELSLQKLILISAPPGCGKTTLAEKLCHDPEIEGTFQENGKVFRQEIRSMSSSFRKENCRQCSLDLIREATNNFDESKVLGKGGEGKVYLADINLHKTAVAVKHLHSNSGEFEDEIRIVSEIQHPNLVSLLGYCEESGHKILVYEYMSKGCLSDYVGKKCNIYVSWIQRLKICLGAARGLQHLHTETVDYPKGIIHRDIKPDNILIDENWVGKISDFGLFKLSHADQAKSTMVTMLKGTAGFYAPEYIRYNSITRKIDVYAFGVVLFLLLCRKLPWDRDDETYIAREDEDLGQWAEQNIDNKIKGEISEDCLKVFTDIIKRSLRENPKERPTMNDVVMNLEKALKFQQPEEEAKLHQDALQRATVFRPMDPRSYFPNAARKGNYYHSFVSYKWETRENFAIPLYHALEHAGFRSFLDAQYGTEVYEAINNSMCVVVLFSKNYISSPGCLDELLQFVEHAKHTNYSLLPIYYEVDPEDVKYLKGIHGSGLEAHRREHGYKVDIWRRAIKEFAEYQPIVMSGDPDKLLDRVVEMVRNEFRRFPTKFWN